MKKLLAACQAYREGSAVFSDRDSGHETPPQPIELVIKEQAHAMKGSAANIRLWRIAKVSFVYIAPFTHPILPRDRDLACFVLR